MTKSPGPTEEAQSGRSREASARPLDPPSAPQTPLAAVSADDPEAPLTHVDGGTYAKGDYSPAARRSQVHQDQLEPEPGPEPERAARSTFASAQDREGPASTGGGH